jgi:three-Cys-motif partner protein
MEHVKRGNLRQDVVIDFHFVEDCSDYEKHLKRQLAGLATPPNFNVKVIPGEFANVVGGILLDVRKQGRPLGPAFAFVDPFGFSGIPFELLAEILSQPRCEVYINIMVDFINRFIEHPTEAITAHFPTTFGTNEVLDIPNGGGDRVQEILSLYRRQLKTKAKFVGRFDMHGTRDQKTYSLFFASNSPLGFLKMKEANWSVDVGEGGKFSDFNPTESRQFNLMTTVPLREEMWSRYLGNRVSMVELERFVIEETDFLPKHARAILKSAEKNGSIEVEVLPGCKRKTGDFPVDKVAILFRR